MSYTPTEWQTGDTITAAGLNKMEQGIAEASSGGGIVVSFDLSWDEDIEMGENRIVLHASLAELIAAWQTGAIVTARGHFDLPNWSEDSYVTMYLSYINMDANVGNVAAFSGHNPSVGGIDAVGFYSDASGETMSTDGGYVPST